MKKPNAGIVIPRLTHKDRIRYRRRGAPKSVEMDLYTDSVGRLCTMSGEVLRWADRSVNSTWLKGNLEFILEAVNPPPLVPYKGMLLEDAETEELWVFDVRLGGRQWTSTHGNAEIESVIADRFAAGELFIFTPKVAA